MTPALELVNSIWWRGRPGGEIDKLDDAAWLEAFVAPLGVPGPVDTDALRELRAVLVRIVEGHSELAALDPFLGRGALRRSLAAGGRLELVPVERDWAWGVSEIAASLVELLAQGEPERLKLCANAECGWAFYDTSRNRSRRWCSSSLCGNTDKVRRFRERRRGPESGTPPAPSRA